MNLKKNDVDDAEDTGSIKDMPSTPPSLDKLLETSSL